MHRRLQWVRKRAGAFFIFPVLIIWAGWIFRETKRFSFKVTGIAAVTILGSYLLVNTVYPRLIGIPAGAAFGNFSWELYGQIHGGTGWHQAIQDLGTTNSTIVYRAAFQYFVKHPFSSVIGAAKSYRDFFLPDLNSVFVFTFTHPEDWPNLLLWAPTIFLLGWGAVRVLKNIQFSHAGLMAAGFIGTLLSIPFLPPIDGGGRFYASTIPFLFILPAVAVCQFREWLEQNTGPNPLYNTAFFSQYNSIILLVLMLIVPISAYYLHTPHQLDTPVCSGKQIAYAVRVNPASYIDLISQEANTCGLIPDICLSEFKKNGTENNIDDFYQELLFLTQPSKAVTRIIPTVNLIDSTFHYFVVADPDFVPAGQVVSCCALEIRTKNQSIYQIESLIPLQK